MGNDAGVGTESLRVTEGVAGRDTGWVQGALVSFEVLVRMEDPQGRGHRGHADQQP